jgi:hypothetical protein
MNTLKFDEIVINTPTEFTENMDLMWMTNSDKFNGIRNGFNDKLYKGGFDGRGNLYKEILWHGYFMFKEIEIVFYQGMIFAGAEFDDLYIGKVQNWSAIEKTKVPEGRYKPQPQGGPRKQKKQMK